jgi:gliding motility-associated-like protein
MKTTLYPIALVFIFTVRSVFSQDVHITMESAFGNFTLEKVVENLKAEKRYANEPLVVSLVDSFYMVFQEQIRVLILSGEYDALETEFKKTEFLSLLQSKLDWLPKNPDTPGIPKILNGPCVNMDFEEGTLNGWNLWRGTRTDAELYDFSNPIAMGGPSAHHTVFAGGVDPVVGIPRVNPDGGNFSVRLGNGTTTGSGAARMSQAFLVDATNYFFTYSYAVVFQNPAGHTPNERPYFTVRVYDELGQNIDCGEFSVYADPLNATDFQSVGMVLYKNWTTVFTNLSAYIGQNVTVEFTSGDCSLSGHYGYAYVDASCALQQITATDYYLCPGETSQLTAPAGIGAYLWSTGEVTQSITVSTGGVYTCELIPFQGPACSVVLDIEIFDLIAPVTDFTPLTPTVCLNEPIIFEDNSSINAPATITSYQWNFGNGVITPASTGNIIGVLNTTGTFINPTHDYTASGNFDVILTVESSDGCFTSLTFPVTINALPIVVAGTDQTICFGEQITLSGAGAVDYSWDNGVTNGLAFVPAIGAVIYTVTGTDVNGCENQDQVTVTVNPLPAVDAGSDQTICFGEQVTLSGAGAVDYAWDNGVTNGVAFAPAVGTIIYTITGTDVNGCENQDQVTVTVNPIPIVDAGSDQTICFGEQVTISGTGAVDYAWDNAVTNGLAFTPAVGTIIYTVTGTDVNGCENQDQVTVTVNPLPVVDAGADQTICLGEQVTLTGAGAVDYAWDNGVTNGLAFVPVVGTVIYTVTGTDVNGCENQDQVTVTVNPLPIVDAGSDQTICFGEQVTLSGAGAVDYAWDNAVTNGLAFAPAVGTIIYTVTGTDVNGCEEQDQVQVTVNPLPIVDAGSDQTICFGEEVTLSGAGATNYSWDNGVINGVAFTPAVGTIIYTVTGTDLNGCENQDQVQVTVNPLPIVDAGVDRTICFGEQVTLSAAGANSYSWNNGVMNGVAFAPAVGTLIYTVTGTDMNGCENQDQVQVTVNPLPNVFGGNDVTICDGQGVILTGSGADFYNWSNGIIDGIVFHPPVGTHDYEVIGSFNTGCFTTDLVRVTVHPRPNVSTDNIEVCKGEFVTLFGNGADAYLWSHGVQDGVPFKPTQSDIYVVTGFNIFGCTDTATARVTLFDYPTALFYPDRYEVTILNPGVQFINMSSGASAYIWNFGDNSDESYLVNPFHVFPTDEPGTYQVQLIAINQAGCTDTTHINIIVNDELIIYVPNTFTPDGDNYNNVFKPVLADGFDPQNYTLLIFNRWGQIVFESHDVAFGWDGTFSQYDQSVQDGTYTWKITVKEEFSTKTHVFVGHVNLIR